MRKNRLLIAMSAAALGFSYQSSAFAQSQEIEVEEVITIGSRAKPRSVTDSPAPVDVISGDDLISQGGSDLSDLMRNVVPSYNVNDQPISDAATLVRPANLRGLAPDHTLLLVNGKRRHRASVITWLGNGISNGSQGPDMSAIPASAINSVEVLRDGAAAQYGSDAIAGVINFGLKNDSEGGSVNIKYGQYTEGDGDQVTIGVNKGLPLFGDGFLNLTAEYGYADPTNRAVQRGDAAGLIEAGFQGVPSPAMVWGTPEIKDDLKLFANFATMLTDSIELYGYGNYNTKTVDGGFYYRNPTARGGVYHTDVTRLDENGDVVENEDGEEETDPYLLIGDLTPNDGQDCAGPFLRDGIYAVDRAGFDATVADPNCFSFQETIPGGFTPRFGGDVIDHALLLGLKGEVDDLTWDVSLYSGTNEADFYINNTVNASYGPDTLRDFDPGAYRQEDFNLSADFTYIASDTVALAFGAEYRDEEFTIVPGQVESYTNGGLQVDGFSTTSNGFPGFSPSISGSWNRTNYSAYIDAEWDVSDDLLLTSAIRFEDFDDFGTTTNYKFGLNYSLSDTAGIRATTSTGFKAPTPGQANASNITTQNVNGVLVNQGVIPSTSAVAVKAGGRPLGPEESTHYTFGAYFTVMDTIDITADIFMIEVSDRLNLSSTKTLSDSDRVDLMAEGVSGVDDIEQFSFFTNDFDTETSGLDLVATTDLDLAGGVTTLTLSWNYTETEVTESNPDTVDGARIKQIEETTPTTRWNVTAKHQMDKFRVTARTSYYGGFYDSETESRFYDALLFDLELGYDVNEATTIALGARNLGNEKGCTVEDCAGVSRLGLGLPYSQYSPFGFNGTFLYGRLNYNF